MGNVESARPEHDALRADRAEMNEITGPLEPVNGVIVDAMPLRGRQRACYDRLVNAGFGRSACRRAIVDDLGIDAVPDLRFAQERLKSSTNVILALARNHAAVQQQIASFRDNVVGMAAVDARDRETWRAKELM